MVHHHRLNQLNHLSENAATDYKRDDYLVFTYKLQDDKASKYITRTLAAVTFFIGVAVYLTEPWEQILQLMASRNTDLLLLAISA